MKSEPILATKTRGRAPRQTVFTVYGGLHFITSNKTPYFALTYWERAARGNRNDGGDSGGAGRETILSEYPQFADLAALHLSDMDGVPMYAEANGFHHLAGGMFMFRRGDVWQWNQRNSGGRHTLDERLAMVADYVRVPVETVRDVLYPMLGDWFSEGGGFLSMTAEKEAAARFAAWCETQRPRWKAEADACIAKHGLVVYGDPWPVGA